MAPLVVKISGVFCFLGVLLSTWPSIVFSQSGWAEPLAPPADPSLEPAPRNPDWADPPPPRFEKETPTNPDWVSETEAPRLAAGKRKASQSYDIRYANRSLTMPRGMMRGTFDTVVGRWNAETISTMSFGAAITLADDFEIGFSRYRMGSFPGMSLLPNVGFGAEGLVGFAMSPDAQFGDIPFYARFEALDRDVVKLGFDAVFRIPSQTHFGFLGGIPLRFVVQERLAIDTGLNFTVDDNPQGPAVWSLEFPVRLVGNVTDQLFLEAMSGMTFFDLSHTAHTVIPLGLRAGYTIEARATMMDVFGSFRFPTFYDFTSSDSSLTTDLWQVTIGINIYSPVLFKGSAL